MNYQITYTGVSGHSAHEKHNINEKKKNIQHKHCDIQNMHLKLYIFTGWEGVYHV